MCRCLLALHSYVTPGIGPLCPVSLRVETVKNLQSKMKPPDWDSSSQLNRGGQDVRMLRWSWLVGSVRRRRARSVGLPLGCGVLVSSASELCCVLVLLSGSV